MPNLTIDRGEDDLRWNLSAGLLRAGLRDVATSQFFSCLRLWIERKPISDRARLLEALLDDSQRSNSLLRRTVRRTIVDNADALLRLGAGRRVFTRPDLMGELLDSQTMESQCYFPAVYGLSDAYGMTQRYGPVCFSRFRNVSIASGSDLVVGQAGCYWYKARHPMFSNMVPADIDLLATAGHAVIVERRSKKAMRVKSALSLLGVHDSHWAHFLAQYLPKIQYLPRAMAAAPDLLVLAPARLDEQARALLAEGLAEFNSRDRVRFVDEATCVEVEELYYPDHPSWIMDNGAFVSQTTIVIPRDVVAYLERRFDKVCIDVRYPALDRVYLRRGGVRATINAHDVDAVMKRHDFTVVDPASLSLEQKKAVFSRARVIVGQFGSSFTNVLMCSPGCKLVAMVNIARLSDAYIPALLHQRRLDMTMVAGTDRRPGDPHSDYTIDARVLDALVSELVA